MNHSSGKQYHIQFSHWLLHACSAWNHEFKNPWINSVCRNHDNIVPINKSTFTVLLETLNGTDSQAFTCCRCEINEKSNTTQIPFRKTQYPNINSYSTRLSIKLIYSNCQNDQICTFLHKEIITKSWLTVFYYFNESEIWFDKRDVWVAF
jgi:hypothetical protein